MTKVSTAKNPITPAGTYFPCYLMGHAIRKEQAKGILNELFTTVLVVEEKGCKVVWISVELIGLEKEFTDKLRKEISEKYKVDKNLINVSFTHTHSAPEYELVSLFGGPGRGAVPGYMDWVYEQIMDAVDRCFHKEFKITDVYLCSTEIKGCYSNRNGLEKPADKSFVTIEFCEDDKVVAGAFVFACHSTVLGPQNLYLSNDLAGYLAEALEKEWGVYPITMVGAAGDMSNRLYRKGNDEEELNRIGTEIMNQVTANTNRIKIKLDFPKVSTFLYQETYQIEKEKKKEQYKSLLEKVNTAKSFDEKKVFSSALKMAELGLNRKEYTLQLECTYVQMGDLKIMTIPAELFSRFGLILKKEMRCKCSVCWCYSNYSVAYLGNAEDYGASFETAASDIPVGTTEKIIDQLLHFIARENT